MSKQKQHHAQKYKHPPKEELRRLYIELDCTIKELAKFYGVPQYTISYLISTKYKIEGKGHRNRTKKIKMASVVDKGLTKERLRELYLEKQWSPKMIGTEYNEQTQYIDRLLSYWDIPKRTHSESIKIAWERKEEKRKLKKRTFIGKKADEIKTQIETGEIDPSEINHKKACILLSCNPGIEKLKKMCDLYGFNFEILANTYKKLEPIWFKLNLYPLINTKIALTLYLRYKISQHICCKICHITEVSFRTFYKILSKKIKLTKEKREDPLTLINIRWLFDNPDLPEIYKTLFTFRENYSGYYCNIDNEECEYFEDWNHRCYKPLYSNCQYAFCKYKSREEKLNGLRTKYDKKEEKGNEL